MEGLVLYPLGNSRDYKNIYPSNEYTNALICIFRDYPNTFVTRKVYNEYRKGVTGLQKIAGSMLYIDDEIFKGFLEASYSIGKQLCEVMKKNHILSFPKDDAKMQGIMDALWEHFLSNGDYTSLSETDFDLVISSLACAWAIGNTALLTEDGAMINSCSRYYSYIGRTGKPKPNKKMHVYSRTQSDLVFQRRM